MRIKAFLLQSILGSLFGILVLSCTCRNTSSESEEISIIKNRLINDALTDFGFLPRIERYYISDFSKAGEYLKTQKQDGSWADIDYETTDNKFPVLKHLDRALVMVINYSKDTCSLYHNPDLLSGIKRAIQH